MAVSGFHGFENGDCMFDKWAQVTQPHFYHILMAKASHGAKPE